MSDYIPLPIQLKIFCQLPIKSLIRFRSVSKEWKCLIDTSEFNSNYILNQAQRKRFLLRVYTGNVDCDHEKGEYCWVVEDEDDDNFHQNKVSLTYPRSVNRLINKNGEQYNVLEFVGSSHGLLCFTGCYVSQDDCFNRYVIWNPSIRKSITIDALFYKHVHVGFGVCPNSIDPKIVRINKYFVPLYYNVEQKLKPKWVWRVEVFTLSEGVWRSPLVKLPSKWPHIKLRIQTPVVLNGFIYWSAKTYYGYHTIISFNLATEEFTQMQLPHEISLKLIFNKFKLFNVRGSLGVVHSKDDPQSTDTDPKDYYHEVWLMDHVSKSFIKMFAFTLPKRLKVVGFRHNDDQLIIEEVQGFKYSNEPGANQYEAELVTYEPNTERFNKLGFKFDCCCFIYYNNDDTESDESDLWGSSFTCYTESLLLLDQSNTLNDDDIDGS